MPTIMTAFSVCACACACVRACVRACVCAIGEAATGAFYSDSACCVFMQSTQNAGEAALGETGSINRSL